MKNSFFAVASATAAAVVVMFSGCSKNNSTGHIAPVKDFKLDSYFGKWYEIARLPHYFERGLNEVYAVYSPNADGTVKVTNSGVNAKGRRRYIHGIAKIKGHPDIGELEVSFFRPFWGDYKIILLENDYSAAAVTSSNTGYLWILARTPAIKRELRQKYLKQLAEWGFSVEKMEFPSPANESSGTEP